MRLFARMRNLVRGTLAGWIGRREHNNPAAVYETAIQERLEQYGRLRAAAAGVLYMRSKLERELAVRGAELERLRRQLDIAVDHDDDEAAVALIARRDGAAGEVDRLAGELTELTGEAEAAKQNLISFQNEIVRLREEKVRMLARLANAHARLRLHETLSGLSPDADIRALEAVREHVNRLVIETHLARDAGDSGLERRLGRIRQAEAESAARAQLEELKRSRRGTLLTAAQAAPLPEPASSSRSAASSST